MAQTRLLTVDDRLTELSEFDDTPQTPGAKVDFDRFRLTLDCAFGQARKRLKAFGQIRSKPLRQPIPRFPRAMHRCLKTPVRYFFTVLRSNPVCRAMALTLKPCPFNSKIFTISISPTTCWPFYWPLQGELCATDV
mgnify:FL=1